MPQSKGQTQKGADILLAELRQKAQITIPKEIIVKLGLSEGDKLDIMVPALDEKYSSQLSQFVRRRQTGHL